MPHDSPTCRFGPFELHTGRRRLTRDGSSVFLPDRQLDVLLILVARAGDIVPKDTLADEAWHGIAVSDNSIVQAVRGLRVALGVQPDGSPYIETLVRKGYRFIAPVEQTLNGPQPPSGLLSQVSSRLPYQPFSQLSAAASLDALLEPYRAFVDGRAAIETLDRSAVDQARQAFAEALRIEPGFAAAHIGMANACLLRYETSRADGTPDPAALAPADLHARESCRLFPSSGDAWSTLALVRSRFGDTREAIGAARKAVTLEPDAWCHYLRLAFVSWGEERLRAARRALSLCPDLALAHWFAATVFVARETFDRALDELRQGCAAQDRQSRETSRFPAVGLHLLHGLVLAATGSAATRSSAASSRSTDSSGAAGRPCRDCGDCRDDRDDQALAEFARELAVCDSGHVYARQSAANSWYATGAVELHRGRIDAAHAAFRQAMACVPGHALARVGLRTLSNNDHAANEHAANDHAANHADGRPADRIDEANFINGAIVTAAALAMEHKHDEAAQVCALALDRTPPGADGWPLPVEPLLRPTVHRKAGSTAWAATLAALHARAM